MAVAFLATLLFTNHNPLMSSISSKKEQKEKKNHPFTLSHLHPLSCPLVLYLSHHLPSFSFNRAISKINKKIPETYLSIIEPYLFLPYNRPQKLEKLLKLIANLINHSFRDSSNTRHTGEIPANGSFAPPPPVSTQVQFLGHGSSFGADKYTISGE